MAYCGNHNPGSTTTSLESLTMRACKALSNNGKKSKEEMRAERAAQKAEAAQRLQKMGSWK